jgi:hypothetical protein
MQTHHYPDYVRHKANHDALTSRVVEFQKEFEVGRVGLTIGLLQFFERLAATPYRGDRSQDRHLPEVTSSLTRRSHAHRHHTKEYSAKVSASLRK